MISEQDHQSLVKATELINQVIERHRSEDLRALSLFNSAIQDMRVGELYLASNNPDSE